MGLRAITWHAVHEGRTKDYFAMLVEGERGRAVCIKRWGKVGTTGQWRIEQQDSGADPATLFQNIIQEKESARKGYQRRVFDDHEECSVEEILGELRRHNCDAENLNHIEGMLRHLSGPQAGGAPSRPRPDRPDPELDQRRAADETWGSWG